MAYLVTGSHGCIGAWVLKTLVARPCTTSTAKIASVAEVIELIRAALPGAKPTIGYDADTQVPVVGAFDDRAFQRDLGPLPCTPLRDGVRQTIAHFERLLGAGCLDTCGLS